MGGERSTSTNKSGAQNKFITPNSWYLSPFYIFIFKFIFLRFTNFIYLSHIDYLSNYVQQYKVYEEIFQQTKDKLASKIYFIFNLFAFLNFILFNFSSCKKPTSHAS